MSRPKRKADDAPLTVSALASRIDGALRSAFGGTVRVVGEISGFRDRTHWYFDLKDPNAVVSCVMFASNARKMRFSPSDGLEVVVSGRVEFYAPGGRTTLVVTKVEPVGEGALDAALRKLIEELRAEGYFDPDNKLEIPPMPRAVAVITSRTGAALQDVIDTARRRNPGVVIYTIDVRVQGERAAGEIALAIEGVDAIAEEYGIDTIILTRGGGSLEDLWAFNEREVADAVYDCQTPIIAAIGHETDVTVAELVADARAATPTQAAMHAIPDGAALIEQVTSSARRMRTAMVRRIERGRDRVESRARHPMLRDPSAFLREGRERVEALGRAMSRAVRTGMAVRVSTLESRTRELEAISPTRVLDRGYSVTLAPDGSVLRKATDAKAGQELTTVLRDGRVRSVVESSSRRPRKKGGSGQGRDQMDLFGSDR